MADPTIRETTIETDAAGSIVRLHIADAPIDDATVSFRLNLLVRLPRYKAPLVLQVQREALLEVSEVLSTLAQKLLQDLPMQVNARPEQY